MCLQARSPLEARAKGRRAEKRAGSAGMGRSAAVAMPSATRAPPSLARRSAGAEKIGIMDVNLGYRQEAGAGIGGRNAAAMRGESC